MKCAKCGAEIKEGCIYCSVCGNAVQIVPDYSVLEDDYLRSLLKEEESAGKGTGAGTRQKQQKAQTAAEEEKSPAAISHRGNSAGASRSGGNSD